MRVLSLFDGMACGMIAMKNAGVDIERYWAYEIDKHAIKTATHNFPEIEVCGDVFSADFTIYRGCDFLIGGSPCTFWSIAQSPDKRETTASGLGWELFSQYVRALREAQPRAFIYENNKSMSAAIRKSISETFGFEPICINSALVSAQNRQRLYWVGIRKSDGTYRKVDVKQPEDRGIVLRNILDGKGKELSGAEIDCMVRDHAERRWSFCVKPAQCDKAGTVTANMCRGVPYNVCAEPVCVAQRGRYNDDGSTSQHIEVRGEKTNALTTVSKDNMILEPVKVFVLPRHDGVQTQGQAFRVYSEDGKAVSLKSNVGGGGAKTGLYAIKDKPMPVREATVQAPEFYKYVGGGTGGQNSV